MKEEQYDRQSFLGADAQDIFSNARIGILGLSGGGSHVAQQAAHIGFKNFALFDPQTISRSNLNRLVGATEDDVLAERPKINIAERVIKGVQPDALVEKRMARWQEEPDLFRSCDILVGCLDSYLLRHEMEVSARRYMIPAIDIGMDVYEFEEGKYSISGQIILSMPGQPCMTCLGFLTDAKLALEAGKYGAAGSTPQVVWSNGVLASTAVGLAVELLTNWTDSELPPLYLTYDGRRGLVQQHPVLSLPQRPCPHFPIDKVGDPTLRAL
ncbi:MAG TPA: ThiF family adenylyltransferase [Pyrinomonadaceae bacterium]|nr:ThiF family adenylyltransferase [Pyrinomonadaceae bacterium]